MQEKTKKGSIIEFLCKDRGNTNTKKILTKITDKHVERVAFFILVTFMVLLFEEQI